MSDELATDKLYRGYRVRGLGPYSLTQILPPKSGQIPGQLDGMYTSYSEACMAIDMYLGSLLNKGRKKSNEEASADPS